MWNVSYIVSQILTVVEYTLLGVSYFAKKRKMAVILDIISMICGTSAYFLLGADLGVALSIIILLANFYYLWDESVRKKRDLKKLFWHDYVALVVVLLAILGVSIWTYDGPLSLLSVAATVLYEISIWQKSTKVYKFLGIPVAFCWMAYNGVIGSIFGVICELTMLVASIWGYLKEYQAEKLQKLRRMRALRRRRRQDRKQGKSTAKSKNKSKSKSQGGRRSKSGKK